MNCRRTRSALPLFVGGDLDPVRASEVERHVAACESCAAEAAIFASSRQSLFALKSASSMTRSPDLWPSVRLRLGTPPRGRRWGPLRAAAAVLLIASGGIALLMGSGTGGNSGGVSGGESTGRPESPVVARQAPREEPVEAAAEVPFESRIPDGPGAFVLAEVGPGRAGDATGSLPFVMPAEPERTGWDEF